MTILPAVLLATIDHCGELVSERRMFSMMVNPTLFERLSQFGADLAKLRQATAELRLAAELALASGNIDTATLEGAEITAGTLYQEISAFKTVLADVEEASSLAAGQLAPVSDALHILLLEVTEIGTRLYSLRSHSEGSDAGKPGAAEEPSSAAAFPSKGRTRAKSSGKAKPKKPVPSSRVKAHRHHGAVASGDISDEKIP